MKILIFISLFFFLQPIKKECDDGWTGSITLFDKNGNVLQTDTVPCGFTHMQELSDWITLRAETMTGLDANWYYNTTSGRLYSMQKILYERDTTFLHYIKSYKSD